jgi:hypothetical protein
MPRQKTERATQSILRAVTLVAALSTVASAFTGAAAQQSSKRVPVAAPKVPVAAPAVAAKSAEKPKRVAAVTVRGKRTAICPPGTPGPCYVWVDVTTFGSTNTVGVNSPPPNPTAVAIIENEGPYVEKKYGFQPSSLDYYIVHFSNNGQGRTEVRFEEIHQNGLPSNPNFWHDTARVCENGPVTPSQVGFSSCARSKGLRRPHPFWGPDDPAWFSCASGCCSAGI